MIGGIRSHNFTKCLSEEWIAGVVGWIGLVGSRMSAPLRAQDRKLTRISGRFRLLGAGTYSFAGSFDCRALLSRHSRNRPDATTTPDPITSETVGTSPQTAKPRMIAHTRER